MKKLCLIVLALIMSLTLCFGLTACSDKTVEQLKNESGALLEGGEFEKGSVLNFDTVDTTSENAEGVFEKLSGIGVEITDKSKAFIYDISVTKDGKEVQPNGKVKITVPMPQDSTATDYSVYHVKDDGEVVKIPSTYADGKLTFETDGFSYYVFVATDYININVTPTPDEVTLIANAGEGGTITDEYANGKKVEKGTSVTLTATATEGYHFLGWFLGDALVSEDATYTFTVAEDMTLEARFGVDEKPAPDEVTLTANAGEGGTVTDGYANGKKVEKGTSVTLTATANNGYHFVGWYNGNNKVSENASYTFTVNEDTTLVAQFEKYAAPTPVEVTLFVRVGEGGTVTDGYANGKKVVKGTSVTLTATANNGYHFAGWYNGNNKVSENASYTFTVNEDTTLVAQFEKDAAPTPVEVTLTANAGEGGTIIDGYANGVKLEKGSSVTLSAIPDNGYHFVGWFVGETKVSDEMRYKFTVNEDTTLVAKFEKDAAPTPVEVTLTANAGEGGTITDGYANGKKVEKGTSVTLTATANNGYHFAGWFNGNNKVSENVSYTFTVNEDTTLVAQFEKDAAPTPVEVTLIANAGEGGSITAGYANGTKVVKGTSVTLTATANENYNFKGWYSYTADQKEVLISSEATHTFECNADLTVYAKFEEKVMYNFLAQCNPNNGGSITENSQTVDFGNGRMVELNTQITLTAVANTGYTFKGWGTLDNDGNVTIISTNATYTFTVTANTYVQAVFEEKPNGLKLDAHNAGFTYENGELTTTIYQIGGDSKPNAENVLVYATYPTQEDRSLTYDTDYTIDLGGLDFTKAGTYTVTYTYKADTSLKATLTVQVKEKPADGSLTESEWNAAIAYWAKQTNIKVFERTVTSQTYDPAYGGMGADIRIYQLAGTAYSFDGYFEDDVLSQQYKGKMTYLVKVGDKYYRYTWNDGEWDDDLREYVNGFWVKEDYNAKEEYESEVSSNIYTFRDSSGNTIVFSYENFTYDAAAKSYKNSDGSLAIAFTFDDNKVLTKIVVTVISVYDDTDFSSTSVSTVTFGDAVVDVPTNAKCSFSTAVTAFTTTGETYGVGGHITENGEQVSYRYAYLNDGTKLTLTAVADEGYVFKHWAKHVWDVDSRGYVWVTYSTDATYTVTADGEDGALYAVFEKVETNS